MTKKQITYKSTNVYAKEISKDIPLYDPTKSLKEQGLKWQDNLNCECQTCKKHFAVDYYVYMQSRRFWAKRNNKSYEDYRYTCKTCRSKGKANSQWKEGKMIYQGYVYLHKSLIEPQYQYLSHGSYVAEHRYVFAKYNKQDIKCLKSHMHIHHKDLNKKNNDMSNLKCLTNTEHSDITAKDNVIKYQNEYIQDLEKTILKLKEQIRRNDELNIPPEAHAEDYKNGESGCD